jgi:hypothetical protein
MRKAQYDEESGNLTANCTKTLHVKKGKPGKAEGNCFQVSKIEFDNYQDAVAWYQSKEATLPYPWVNPMWPPGSRPPIGTDIGAICPGCPGESNTFTRR